MNDEYTGQCDIPPSANNLFINTRTGRVKAPAYRAWLTLAGYQLGRRRQPISPAMVAIRVGKCNAQRDLDNISKAILDALVSLGWLANDNVKNVTGLTLAYMPEAIPAESIEVIVRADSFTEASNCGR